MKTIYITRRETFNAAHKLYQPNWTEEENNLVFGKCANKNWHGHNFTLFVTVKGVPNKETGFVMNLKTLSEIINTHVIESLDHKNLNLDVSYLTGIMASTENLAIAIWDQLANEIAKNGGELAKIKLIETENNFVEYFGGREPF
jgi:6-pyruvoyltetrahydropterin/6-carboxytetrahydropterin synthase